jgi:poly-gamma-glutamate synthesis protein (capsule biosynthesis protein)
MTVTVATTGDLLTHMPVNADAKKGGGYDFSPLLAGADAWIAGADLAICQMEPPIAPDGTAPSGYPVFGAPKDLVRDIKEQGFDGCTTASNHSVDKGLKGVQATIDALKEQGMGYAGTALSAEQEDKPQLYRFTQGSQTLTIAHFAATYGTNGIPIPSSAPWSVTLIDVKAIVARAKAAREAGADIVIVSIHAGVEDRLAPSAEQTTIAKGLADSGVVDAMIGDHPHVVEPIELIPGGVDGQGMWTIYSMGNYICNPSQVNTETGAVIYTHITKEGPTARVTGMTWAGVTVNKTGHKIFMLEDAGGGGIGGLTAGAVAARYDHLVDVIGPAAPEQKEPPVPSGATLEVVPRG